MTKEQVYEAIGHIDETFIREAHEVAKKPQSVRTKWAVIAACLCLLLTAVFASAHLLDKPGNTDRPDTSIPQDIPQYVPSHSSPDLAALYKEAPYSVLLPGKIPETFVFESSYKAEYDPIANPNGEQYLWLDFRSEQYKASMEIKVMEYDGKGRITDPTKTDTYDLSLYYDYLKTPGTVGADAPKVLKALFCGEDLSESIVKKRMYVFDDGLCKAEIQIVCGEHIVDYHYAGMEISPRTLYEVIASSRYFLERTDAPAE